MKISINKNCACGHHGLQKAEHRRIEQRHGKCDLITNLKINNPTRKIQKPLRM